MSAKKNVSSIIALANAIVRAATKIYDVDNKNNYKVPFILKSVADMNAVHNQINDELIIRSDEEYQSRRDLAKIFHNDEIFSQPGWDILLDLFSSHLKGKKISITSAYQAANVPATTALRWLKILEDDGLVERIKDPTDGRRSFVKVTPSAIAKLTKALTE
jgi:DNA-binding MarR family transcriptional regulator